MSEPSAILTAETLLEHVRTAAAALEAEAPPHGAPTPAIDDRSWER